MRTKTLPDLFHRRCCGCGEGQSCFGGNRSFFLPRRSRNAGARACARSRSDQSAFPASSDSADESASRGSAANLFHVALGMALALGAVRRGCDRNCLAINFYRGEPERELAGIVQSSAGFRVGYFALYGRARIGQALAVDNQSAG